VDFPVELVLYFRVQEVEWAVVEVAQEEREEREHLLLQVEEVAVLPYL
jgi:hypothetical protein